MGDGRGGNCSEHDTVVELLQVWAALQARGDEIGCEEAEVFSELDNLELRANGIPKAL